METEDKLKKVLREICENCNFYNLRPTEESQFREFVEKLNSLIDEYEQQEAKQVLIEGNDQVVEYHESELDTASEDDQ